MGRTPFTEKLRRIAYLGMNSPPFLNQKYTLRHYFSNAQTIANDVRQTIIRRDSSYYKQYEQEVIMGVLSFTPSTLCNAKCVFCAYKGCKDPISTMPFNTFKKAADEYAEMGGKTIAFTPIVGEALLDPGILEKVDYAAKLKGIESVQFYTNGILLGKNDLFKKLVHSGLHELKISMAETDREGYNKAYGVKAYDILMEGLHKLLAYNKEQGEKIAISLNFRSSVGPDDVINSPDFVEFIKPYLSDRVMYDFINDYDNWGGTIKREHLLGVMKLRRAPKVKRMPCIKTFDLMILPDGKARLCACRIVDTIFDELVVGDIHNESLREIFYGKRATALHEAFANGKLPPVCKTCTLYAPASIHWLKRRLRGERTHYQLPFGQ